MKYKVLEHQSIGNVYEVEADSEEMAEQIYHCGELIDTTVVECYVVQTDLIEESEND
tara:strand:- start:78 stop:248 length:171 start_codon:yes stop_codon:yes gene_type:complete